MSLDVYLTLATPQPKGPHSGIFVRRGGQMVEISREEWDAENPGREPVVMVEDEEESGEVFQANITHNLNGMAKEAGIYEALWRPDEIGISQARQLIEPLRNGLARLRLNPQHYVKFNPENGWGSYDGFVPWVQTYLDACERYPDATVRVSR